MQRVFITGGTGFVGAAVARQLVERGAEVALLVRPGSRPWRLGATLERATVVTGVLDDPSTYEAGIARFAPDTVMHLGWHGVARGRRDDVAQIEVNVVGSVGLLLAAAAAGCRHFIGAGSQAEYGACPERIHEDRPLRPASAYGAAKATTFRLLGELAPRHGVRFAWLRLFSVYGPRDDLDTLVSALVAQLLRRGRPALTAGTQVWDLVHVDDAAAAFLATAVARAEGAMNVGSGAARPLVETITMIRDMIDPALPLGLGEIASAPHAITWLEPDIDRIRRLTGWRPRIGIEAGLRDTIEWHRAQAAHAGRDDA